MPPPFYGWPAPLPLISKDSAKVGCDFAIGKNKIMRPNRIAFSHGITN